MKILQINASYKPAYIYGGPTMSVSKLSEQLIQNGCKVQVFTTTANGTTELPVTTAETVLVSGVPVRYFRRLTKDHSHFSLQLLWTLWREVRNFDLVHIHAWWNLVSVLSCLIALLRRTPVVVSPRGTLSPYTFSNNNVYIKRLLHNFIGKYLLKHCHLHSTSEREQLSITKLLKPKSIFNIYNLVNLPDYVPPQHYENKLLKILFLSRIEQKKGLEMLIDALSKLDIPYQLTIAGTGNADYLGKLKHRSRKLGIEAHIQWAGFRDHNKFELIARNDMLILPSYDENFGNVVIESLSVGTAVLISKEVGLASYIQKNNLGWICDTTVSSIVENLKKINCSRGKLAIIREFAPIIIARSFNDKRITRQYINMYRDISRKEPLKHE